MNTMFHSIRCILIGIMLATASSVVLANQKQATANLKLAPEVLTIMQGNQATLDSVRTMQATIKRVTIESFDGKLRRKLAETEKIWYDGTHLRKDQLESKFTEKEEDRGYESTPLVGVVGIDSAEYKIDYIPTNNIIFVRPAEWNNRYRVRENPMLKYQSASGATLKENILASAKNGYYYTTQSEKIDGDDCVLLTCDYTEPDVTQKIWVVPSKGHCIKKVQKIDKTRRSKGSLLDEYTTTLKEYAPGVWWFDTVKAHSWRQRQGYKETRYVELSVDSFIVKKPIDAKIFTIAGIKLPSCGARIINEITSSKEP